MSRYEHRLATLAREGRTARAIGKILRGEGHDVSDSTVGRRMAGVLGRQRVTVRARPDAPAPPPRAMKDVLAGLSPSDRELVLAALDDAADEAVDARDAEITAILARIGAEQDASPICPTCGLQGSNSKLLVRR